MKRKLLLISFMVCVSSILLAQEGTKDITKYLGEVQPGLIPKVFAPGVVSVANQFEYGNTFSADGKEFYYAVNIGKRPEIRMIKFENNAWAAPVTVFGHEKFGYNDPFLSPDQKRMYFISDRALDGTGELKDIDIWYAERTKDGWSEPINAGPAINTDKHEYYISFTKTGKMYFSSNGGTTEQTKKNHDIKTSEFKNGKFQPSVKLGEAINTSEYEADVFVSPNEDYIIFCSERPGGKGSGDLYISFKDNKGDWLPAKNMGGPISTGAYEFCPFVSSDGKYLFFSRSGDIYWVSADIIKTLRN
jgi:hypothetical protein